MRHIHASIASAALLMLAAPVATPQTMPLIAQQAFTAEDIKVTDFGGGLYMLEGRGGNMAVLTGADGTIVIDSQYANIAAANLTRISALAEGAPLRFLINTHWHGDHTGGNTPFADAGATIIAHDGVLKRLSSENTRVMDGETRITPPADPSAWPVLTFSDTLQLRLNGQDITLTHLPAAHTDGDAFVHFRQANVIHTGDVLFSGMFPFIDLDSGGTVDGFIAGLEAIVAAADEETRIIPGHGPLSTRADLQASIDLVRETSLIIREEVRQGRSLEEILAANPLADWDTEWSWNFITTERFTTILYRDAAALSQ